MEYKEVFYDYNLDSYSAKTDSDYNRNETKNKIQDWLNNTNWENESKYHNTYYLGKGRYGYRQITCNNKEYVKRIQALLSSSKDETGAEVSK